MAKWLIWFGGRRFFLTLGCGIVCTILVAHGKISDAIFRDIIMGTVGFYIAGNVYQKVKEKAINASNENN